MLNAATTAPDVRVGDWMLTATGRVFWPLDPRPEEVCIEDIAHALSNLCRYGGHATKFYSVAQHCVLLSRKATPDLALEALMHDAAEAYVVDIPRPLKRFLPGYAEIEQRVHAAIAARFNLAPEIPIEVKAWDELILVDEMAQVMPTSPRPLNLPSSGLGVEVRPWPTWMAKRWFLHRFRELTGG